MILAAWRLMPPCHISNAAAGILRRQPFSLIAAFAFHITLQFAVDWPLIFAALPPHCQLIDRFSALIRQDAIIFADILRRLSLRCFAIIDAIRFSLLAS